MKKNALSLMALFFSLFMGLGISSCDDKITEESEGLSIKVFSPTKVIEGQEVVISGTNLDEVTAVIFPGNVSVTEISRVTSGDIHVITPAGIAPEGGELIIQAGDRLLTARIPMIVGNPVVKTAASTFNKYGEIETGSELTVTGTDMEFFEKAILQGEVGDITVEAIDFIRKSTDFLKFKVPAGFRFSENMEIRVVTCANKEVVLPKIQRPEVVPTRFTGEWKWGTDHANGFVYGAGGYGYSYRPDWGGIAPGGTDGGITVPAKEQIIFGNAPELIFTRITEAGDTIRGTYRVDMTKQKIKSDGSAWSIGELYIDGAALPVNMDYWASGSDLNTFDIITLTEDIIVLAHPHENAIFEDPNWGGMCTMWCFVPKGSSTYPVNMDLAKGQKIKLEGIEDIADWWIDPDWFVRVEGSDTEFIFQAMDGKYKINADRANKCFSVVVLDSDGTPAITQEDGTGTIWVLGDGVGKPSVANAPGWNPGRGICMAPIGDKKYRLTLVGGKQIATDVINFKFFHQDNWGGEFTNTSLTTGSDVIAVGANDGHDPGNLYIRDGVTLEADATYEFIVDLSAGRNSAVLTVTKK